MATFSAEHDVPIREPITDTTSPSSYTHASTGLVFLGDETKERLRRAKQIESYIQLPDPEFRLSCENVVTILLVPLHMLQEGGVLWAEPESLEPSCFIEERLDATSPFCKHYMLHLDADNLKDPKWQYAVYKPPVLQPDLNDIPYEDWQMRNKAIEYYIRFRAGYDLLPVLCNTAEEAKCLDRDGHKCIATGKSFPRVFYFIPFTWNDTVEHMNATGSAYGGSNLADTCLMSWPNPAVSVKKLGATHMAWNMLSIDSVMYSYLKDGLCAFRYAEGQERSLGNGCVQVTLEFYWMPELKGRFGQLMDLEDWPTLCGELARFENCPQESFRCGELHTKSKTPVLSGHTVNVNLPEDDVEQFKDAVSVHWTSIVFAAVCGAAGRPWLLSGDDPEDESLLKRQYEARIGEDGQGGTIRKILDLATSKISKGKRKVARLAGKRLITARTEMISNGGGEAANIA